MKSDAQIGNFLKNDLSLSDFADALLTVLYPHSCQICEQSVETRADGIACRKCWRKTKVFSGEEILCRKCGAYLRDGKTDFEVFCRLCDEHFYERAFAVGLYEKALQTCVLNLKKEPFLPQTLKNLLEKAFRSADFPNISQIIPVPLSEKRLRERGFNQSLVLADFLGKRFKIPVNDRILRRQIHTNRHRAGMDRKARRESVENAFAVVQKRLVENQTLLLVDDVLTSGATVSSCAKELKENGADAIFVFTIARAV